MWAVCEAPAYLKRQSSRAVGQDYGFVDAIYGHLRLARENVSRVLSEKVDEGFFCEDKAVDIARALFYENPLRILKLQDKYDE